MNLSDYNLLDAGAVGLLIIFTGAVIQWLSKEVKNKELIIAKIQNERREDAIGNLQVLDDIIEMMNTMISKQTNLDESVNHSFEKIATHISERTQRLEDIINANHR